MKEITKYGFAFLIIALNSVIAEAQASEPYSDLQKYNYASVKYLIQTNVYKLSAADLRGQAVAQDNELVSNSIGQNTNIYANPLQLNGQLLDYSDFDLRSSGVLTVVRGNPESKDAQAVPFYVSIRRNGKIIENKKMLFLNKAVNKINLSDIFAFCKEGDVLIINPSRAEDWKAKRIMKLFGGC